MQHRLRGRHDQDSVRADERWMDAERHGARRPQLDEVVALDVVNLDVTVETARELGRHERLELIVAGTPRQSAGDEERLIAGRNPKPLELRDSRRDRGLAR